MPETLVTRADIAAAALSLVGKPYTPQGRATAAVPGLDCGGVAILIGQRTGVSAFDILGYADNPDGETFERLLDENFDRLEDIHAAKLGDILACEFVDPRAGTAIEVPDAERPGIQHIMVVVDIHPTRRDSHHYAVVHATRKHGVNRGPIPYLYYRSIVRAYSVGRYVTDK